MTLKKMFVLGSVLAGAAYLQNKSRRDRVFGQARGIMDKAKTRASDFAHQAQSKINETVGTRKDNGVASSVGATPYGGGSGFGGSNYR